VKEVSYKLETLGLLNQLATTISSSIIVNKADGKIKVAHKNPPNTIVFAFEASESDFDFNGDEVAFYNFNEFYQMVSAFKDPKIAHSENEIIISKSNTKIKYITSDSEMMDKVGKGIASKDTYDAQFILPEDELKNYVKMVSLVGTDVCSFTSDGTQVNLAFTNKIHKNSFEKIITETIKIDPNLSIKIPSEIFTIIPNGTYTISIWSEKVVILELRSETISLKIMTQALDE